CRRKRYRLAGPLRVALVEQGEVEQPLTGVVDDVNMEPACRHGPLQQALRTVFDRESKLADTPGALGPTRWIAEQRLEMRFIVEPRDIVVGLRLQVSPQDAALRVGVEEWQPPAVRQIANERGDENGLAGAREPRHA